MQDQMLALKLAIKTEIKTNRLEYYFIFLKFSFSPSPLIHLHKYCQYLYKTNQIANLQNFQLILFINELQISVNQKIIDLQILS